MKKKKVKAFFITAGKERRARERRVLGGLQNRFNRYTVLIQQGFDFREELELVKQEMAEIAQEKQGGRF